MFFSEYVAWAEGWLGLIWCHSTCDRVKSQSAYMNFKSCILHKYPQGPDICNKYKLLPRQWEVSVFNQSFKWKRKVWIYVWNLHIKKTLLLWVSFSLAQLSGFDWATQGLLFSTVCGTVSLFINVKTHNIYRKQHQEANRDRKMDEETNKQNMFAELT